jgi:hypothetical protein
MPLATHVSPIANWFEEELKAKVPAGGAKSADGSAPALPARTVERLLSAPVGHRCFDKRRISGTLDWYARQGLLE